MTTIYIVLGVAIGMGITGIFDWRSNKVEDAKIAFLLSISLSVLTIALILLEKL